jgi:hypothetical protein
MYTKINQLISQVYPDYSPNYNLMRGNVVKLTIGDYLYRMPGFLENVNVTIDNNTTPWEILLNQFGAEDDVRQLPHMVTIQCSFKPIMDILPRKVNKENPFVPLIANKDRFIDPTATTPADRRTLVSTNNSNSTGLATGVQNANQGQTTPLPASQVQPRRGGLGGLGVEDFNLSNSVLIGG